MGAAIALFLAGIGIVLAADPAAAAAPPTFETSTGNPGTQGSVGFYNSAGTQIYSGTITDDPIAAYFVASGGGIKTGDHIATAYSYTPQDNVPADQWTTPYQLTAGDEFAAAGSTSGYPGGLKNTTKAITPGVGGGLSITDAEAAFPLASTKDPGVLQIRILTSGDSSKYYSTDIQITGNSWTQIFPAPPAPSKVTTSFTTINATPASPVAHGSTVTLTSTLSAGDSTHPAGTVHLFDGATDKGAVDTFTASTGAVSATDTPADGSHSYTFKFTPTDTATYSGTTSAALAYAINPVTATTTTVVASPNGSATAGATVTLTATVNKAAAGSVQFMDGTTAIGSAASVTVGASSATASTTTSTLAVGSHSLKAIFTSADQNAFSDSTSAVVSYSITKISTSTVLNIVPATTVTAGTTVVLNATISPSVNGGTVQFFDGASALGTPQAVSNDNATLMVPSGTLSAFSQGSHNLKATFTPSGVDTPTMTGSTSAVQALTVTAGPVTPTITLSSTPAQTVVSGAPATITATFTPSSAVGTVQFMDGVTPLGSPVTISAGKASLTSSSLALGDHPITAVYSAGSTAFNDTTSGAYTVTIIPPPTATSTALSVTPGTPAAYSTVETLTATVTGTGAAGTVKFLDGTTQLGTATVSAGTATATVTLAPGNHSLKAQFVPTDATAFAPSESASQAYTVNKPPATATTTTLAATPSPASVGGDITLSANVALGTPNYSRPAAVGSVEFFDGTTSLGTAQVAAGKATLSLNTLALGDHTVNAVFSPSDATEYVTSTSADVMLTIKAAAVIESTTVNGAPVAPGDELAGGDTVHLTGSGFVPGETVSVVLHSTPITLTTVTADQSGNVDVTVTLPANIAAGPHTLVLSGSADAPAFAFTVAAAAPSVTPTPTTPTTPGATTPAGTGTAAGEATGGGSLASTGAFVLQGVALGLLLTIAGAGTVLASRRRRSH